MRKSMILANIENNASLYTGAHRWEGFYRDTFNPCTNYDFIVLGAITGKTYTERKARARDLAVAYSLFDCGGLSWGEYAEIGAYFENLAHRFGLVEEFRENGII